MYFFLCKKVEIQLYIISSNTNKYLGGIEYEEINFICNS